MHNQLKTLKAHKNSELFTKYICNLSFLGILDESMIINDSATYDELDLNFINEQITLRQKFKAEKNMPRLMKSEKFVEFWCYH